MRRTALLVLMTMAPLARADDPLAEAQAVLSRVGSAPAGSLKVEAVAPAPPPKPEKPGAVGTWATATNEWEFRADGTFRIVGTRNQGQWKETAGGIAILYSGATVWLNLKWSGDTLVDQDGYIGRATLKRK